MLKRAIGFVGAWITIKAIVGAAHVPHAPQPVAQREQVSDTGLTEVVLEKKPDGHFYADALVNGQPVHFLVDTGSTSVALTMDDARHIGLGFSPDNFHVVGKGASGDVRGVPVTLASVAIGKKQVPDVSGVILDQGLNVSLLGQSFLNRLYSVRMADDRMTLR